MTGQVPATPTAAQAPAQGTDLASLQVHVAELRVQLAGLQAQWQGLRAQLDEMLRSNPARPGVSQQWADVGTQIARVQGDIAQLEARIAQREGRPIGTPSTQGRPPSGRPFDPNMVVPGVTIMMLVLAVPVSFAWARRILRGAPKPAPVPNDITMRLERIEQAVDTIAIEVERVSEGQRFVTKVLVQRPAQAGDAVESVKPAAEDLSMPQAKSPLALGAGPMEPIGGFAREPVRERIITPH